MESVNAAIIYYSRTGTIHAMAQAAVEGAEKGGAQVRLRKVAGKVYGAFTASNTAHGGQESTILALGNTFYHWGGIIVPPGYTDPVHFKAGNPYGASHVAGDGPPTDITLEAVRHQARRAVETAAALKAGQAARPVAKSNNTQDTPSSAVEMAGLRQRTPVACLMVKSKARSGRRRRR